MKQEERKKTTINKILSAAIECFEEKGFENTPIEDICERAGITKGGFYHHFANKQELFLKMLDAWINKVSANADLEGLPSGDVYQTMLEIPRKLGPVFEETKSQLPLFLEIYLRGIKDPELNKVMIKAMNMFMAFFEGIIEEGLKKKAITDSDPKELPRILFALTIGLMMQGLMDPKGADWNDLAKKSIKKLLR